MATFGSSPGGAAGIARGGVSVGGIARPQVARTGAEALAARYDLTPAQRLAFAEALQQRRGQGGFLGALARDFADLVTALPASAVFAGRLAASGISYAGGAGIAAELGAPGLGWLRSFNHGSARQAVQAGRAIVADYKYRYSPLFGGNYDEFGRRFMEHPLSYLLDLGAGYSALGKGASLGARSTGFGPRGRFTVAPGEGTAFERAMSYLGDTSAAGRRRARDDRVVQAPVQFTGPGQDILPVVVPRRAGSLNPLTNALQRRLDSLQDARDAAIGYRQTGLQQIGSFTVPGSALARYNTANRRIGQSVRIQATDEARRDFANTSKEYQRLIRKMGSVRTRLKGRQGWEDALYLHATGLLDYRRLGFDSPQEALQGAIDFWDQGIREAREAGERVDKSEKALDKMRELLERPDLLDFEQAPPALRDAVAEAKRIIGEGQSRIDAQGARVSRASGLLTREQIEFSRQRKARAAFGQSFQDDAFFDPDRVVSTPEGLTTVTKLEARRAELIAEAAQARQPLPRAGALAEARRVERQIQEAVQQIIRGNREEGRRMIREGTEAAAQLRRDSEARLPGDGRLARAEYEVPGSGGQPLPVTPEALRARVAQEEGAIGALRARMEGAREDLLTPGGPELPDNPIAFMRDPLEALPRPRRRGKKAEAEAVALAGDPARVAEAMRARFERARKDSTRADVIADLAEAVGYDLVKLRMMAKDAANDAKSAGIRGEKEQAKALAWAQAVRDAFALAVRERIALAPPGPIRDQLLRVANDPSSGLPAPGDDLPIRHPDDLRAAREELHQAQRRLELVREALENERPDDLRGLELRAAALERAAKDLRAPHEAYLADVARAIAAERAPRRQGNKAFTGNEQQELKGDNAKHSGRRKYDERYFDPFTGRRKTMEQLAEDFVMELRYRVSQGEDVATDAEVRMLEDLDRAADLMDTARRDREAIRELSTPENHDWLEDPYRIDQARERLREAAQGKEILAALERLKDELAGDLGESLPEIQRMRAQRNRNASGETGPDVRVDPAQARRGRRQAKRMFGPGLGVPRSRSGPAPLPAGLSPMEEAIQNIGSGQMREWAALERLLPADAAREHRAAIARVHEELGAVRASFGATPEEYASLLAELRGVRAALKVARKKSTGGWTTPRPVEALHSQLPQTAEMLEAGAGLQKLRDQRAEVVERLRELEDAGAPEDTPEVIALLRRRDRLDSRYHRAEVAYHELETHEAIRQFGEFADPDGAYWPDRPRRGQSPKEARDDRGGRPRPQNRVTAERIQQNKGSLFRSFNISTGRRDPLNVLLRGIRSEHSANALVALVERAGARWATDQRDSDGILSGTAGDLITGPKVVELMKASPDVFRAIHLPSLQNVLERLRNETPDGEWPEQTILERVFQKAEDADDIEDALRRGDWKADDVILIPKAAADEYVDASHGIFRGYDNALGVWKAGVLVFTPRWYLLNLIGNSIQYGLLSGGDIRSVLQAGLGRYLSPTKAGRKRAGEVADALEQRVPEAVASVAQASETGVAEGVARLGKVADRLFEFNQTLEALIRRAAYLNAAKRQLKYAGERKRTRRADELIDALDEIEPELREEAIRESLLFLGDYRSFNRVERGFIRRIAPFYSWLRVIHRLTLSLPFKSPLRAQALALMATAAQAQWDPLEEALELGRPLFARGALTLPDEIPVIGGLTLRTNQLNPFATTLEVVPGTLEALGREGPSAALGEAVQSLAGSLAPGVVPLIESVTPGYQVFGNRAVSAPAGYGGIVSSFGGRALAPSGIGWSPVSGPEVPLVENLLQTLLPYYGSTFRQALEGGSTAYDTTTLPSLVAYRLGFRGRIPGVADARPGQVFKTPNPEYPPITSDAVGITPVSGFLGFPLSRRASTLAEIQQQLRNIEEAMRAQEQTRERSVRQTAGAP